MGHDAPSAVDCAPFIDALIEAARSSESAHTRAVGVDLARPGMDSYTVYRCSCGFECREPAEAAGHMSNHPERRR